MTPPSPTTMVCSPDQHVFPPGTFLCSRCQAKRSALINGGGLPYAGWSFVPGPHLAETPRSTSRVCVDGRTGQSYAVREYLPEPVADSRAQRMRFVQVAKSLRAVPLASMQVLFPYTTGGRLYTAAPLVPGTPLPALLGGNRVPEADASKWLRSILEALQTMHNEAGEAGALFHGHLQVRDILVQGNAPGERVELTNSLYLEQVSAEVGLPREHFVDLDLRAAGNIALSLVAGNVTRPDWALMTLRDPVLGGTLDYLLQPLRARAISARHALEHQTLLTAAHTQRSRRLFEDAHKVSGSKRLEAILASLPAQVPLPQQAAAAPPPPPPAPAPPAASPASTPRPQVPPPPVPPPVRTAPPTMHTAPPAPPWRPVGPPTPPPTVRPRPPIGPRRHRFAKFLLGLVALVLLSLFLRRLADSAPPALDPPTVSVSPGTAHAGDDVILKWAANGYTRVLLNGERVGNAGFRHVSPSASVTYKLVAVEPDGESRVAETRLIVVRRATRKPKAGSAATDPPPALQDASPQPGDGSGQNMQ